MEQIRLSQIVKRRLASGELATDADIFVTCMTCGHETALSAAATRFQSSQTVYRCPEDAETILVRILERPGKDRTIDFRGVPCLGPERTPLTERTDEQDSAHDMWRD